MARSAIGGRRKKGPPAAKKLHVRRGDRVRVIRGNDAGKEGTIMRVILKDRRVVVEGINMRKRHMRPSQTNQEGGIVTFEAPIDASNVMLIDPSSGEPSRIRKHTDADGVKERIAIRSGTTIPKPTVQGERRG